MNTEPTRTAIVTGGANGIGAGIVTELLSRGHNVVAVDHDEAALQRLATEHESFDQSLLTKTADVSSVEDWASTVADTKAAFGPAGILVNNAAISPKHEGGLRAPSDKMTLDEWHRVLAVNLTGGFLGFQAVISDMQDSQWGRIINISSTAGRNGARNAGIHYGAAKAGILGVTKTLAWEFGKDGITVNAVAPGRVMTQMATVAPDHVNAQMLAGTPVARFGEASDIATVVAFLASDGASFVTGATIDANGGGYMC